MQEPIDVLLYLLKVYVIGCGFATIVVALWNKFEKNPEELLHPAFVFMSWPAVILGILAIPVMVVKFVYYKFRPYIDVLLHYKNEN